MKKLLLFVAIMVLGVASASAQSENYKAFKVDVGTLYAVPGGDDIKAGIGFYFEPKYNVSDNIAVGLKMEWAVMGSADKDGQSYDVSALGTYQLTGDYYFGDSKVRPFVGLGTGIYSIGSVEQKVNISAGGSTVNIDGNYDYGSKFGFAPRAGVLLGHFRLGLEYNIITGIESAMESRNYLSFKLGFEIGGGRK